MSDLRIRSVDESELSTVLASDVEFEGEMSFDEPVLIKGSFRGRISSGTSLYIGETANVMADVHAELVSVQGKLKGDISAARRLELFSGSQLRGSVVSPDIIMQSGAELNGTVKMESPSVRRKH
ncbi:MAG: polymer-forming cytoskeletal protein [Spirochaetaceae bacterium]|nr:MAG: polymer-forming cytoskeletal protein [Spirochaetaceae bacterium]